MPLMRSPAPLMRSRAHPFDAVAWMIGYSTSPGRCLFCEADIGATSAKWPYPHLIAQRDAHSCSPAAQSRGDSVCSLRRSRSSVSRSARDQPRETSLARSRANRSATKLA